MAVKPAAEKVEIS